MNLKAIGRLAALLLVVAKTEANEPPASCPVYFSVLENDQGPAHLSALKMNKPQSAWYEKHGNRDKYAGICYVENSSGAPIDAPLYSIVWGAHLASEPYVFSYDTSGPPNADGNATKTDQNRDTSNKTSDTKQSYVADGWLAIWDPKANGGKGSFLSIAPLHSSSRTDLNAASTSLLKDALEQISQREKEKLGAAAKERDPHKTKGGNSRDNRNGWTEVTITPINNGQPVSTENSSTPQSSPNVAQSKDPAPVQTTVPEFSPPPSSALTSTVTVTSGPPGADIFVDEDFVGNTPSTLNVTPGRHVITVKKPGFQTWARIVNFSGGSITLNADLVGRSGESPPTDAPATADSIKESAAAAASTTSLQRSVGWIGVSAKNGSAGALVIDVAAEGPAARAGIRVGDIILSLDGRMIKGKDFETEVTALKPGTRVPVDYTRGSAPREVWITVGSQN